MTETRLKPCPFCGGKAHLTKSYNAYDEGTYFSYQCRDCRAKSGEKYARDACPVFYAGLREEWNKRTPAPEAGWRGVKNAPDWEGFGRALMEDWPTGDIDGSQLFDMSLKYGLIAEVPGGYNPDEHIDAEGICPETGDPWFEYAFGTQPATEQQSVKEAARVDVEAVVRLAHSMTGDWDHIEVHLFETALRSLARGES